MISINEICRKIEQMPIGDITPIARSAVRSGEAVVKSWTADPMVTDSVGAGTIGFARVRGTALSSDGPADWSVVVKDGIRVHKPPDVLLA